MAKTYFSRVYDMFFQKITDDMYMELTEQETESMAEDLLLEAIPHFEFPRKDLTSYETSYFSGQETYQGVESGNQEVVASIISEGYFNVDLTDEEANILAIYMVVAWLGQQLANVENVRLKYSGSDFKFTSQANHIKALISLKKDFTAQGFHLQRLYKRRKVGTDGVFVSTFDGLAGKAGLK